MIKMTKTVMVAILLPLLWTTALHAGSEPSTGISWGFLVIGLLGGLAFFLYDMEKMSDAMKPLRRFPEFVQILKKLENPVMGILVGTIITALVQSSGAFIGLVIVLAQQGLIGLEAGIPMIFGANIAFDTLSGSSTPARSLSKPMKCMWNCWI